MGIKIVTRRLLEKSHTHSPPIHSCDRLPISTDSLK